MSNLAAYNADRSVIEAQYQADVARSLTLGADAGNALNSADRVKSGRILAAAAKYSDIIPPAGLFGKYKEWVGPRDAPITRTDATTFNLAGGKYLVIASATWGGGTVDVLDSNSKSILAAPFSANGSTTVEAGYGSGYALSIVTATGVSVTIKPLDYV